MNRRAFLGALVAVPAVVRTLDGGWTVLAGRVSGRRLQAPVRLLPNTILEHCDIVSTPQTRVAIEVTGPCTIRHNRIAPADWLARHPRQGA